MSRKMFVVTVAGIVLLAGAILAAPALRKFRVVGPRISQTRANCLLQQGWTDEQRFRFHHTAQGTRLFPTGGSWLWSSHVFRFLAVIPLPK